MMLFSIGIKNIYRETLTNDIENRVFISVGSEHFAREFPNAPKLI